MKVAQLREHARELGFTPQDSVRWLAPAELLRTALQAGLASAFSSFTDKRELQQAFPDHAVCLSADDDGGCWFDFVADIGDGFDPTYTVALLLAQERLEVGAPAGDRYDLPRGSLLVLGGDAVYPAASSTGYEDRMKGPYRSALGAPEVGDEKPMLVALPGNHDWYDGLTAFLRVFGQRRRIGGWQTVQSRSYFVVELPHRWWLVGLDSQLGTEIDDPQLDFFRKRLTAHLRPGDGVILACAGPSWVHTPHNPSAFDSLHYFERTIVRHRTDPSSGDQVETGAQVRLWITGDHHHYARFAEHLPVEPGEPPAGDGRAPAGDGRAPAGDGDSAPGTGLRGPVGAPAGAARQLVTCGLGGAYLSMTHRLPERLHLPPRDSTVAHPGDPARFNLAKRWPDAAASRRMLWGLFAPAPRGLPFRNPGFWRLVGGAHAALFAMLAGLLGLSLDRPPTRALRQATLGEAWQVGLQLGTWLLIAIVVWSLLPLIRRRRPQAPSPVAVLAVIQLAVAVACLAATVWVVRAIDLPRWVPGGRSLPDFIMFGVALLLVAVVGGLIGSYGAALTLVLTRDRRVVEWQASAQAREDRKGFVRLRIDPVGRLVLHPVVVDAVCHDWTLVPARTTGGVRPVPSGGLPRARLVEEPVMIARSPRPADRPSTADADLRRSYSPAGRSTGDGE